MCVCMEGGDCRVGEWLGGKEGGGMVACVDGHAPSAADVWRQRCCAHAWPLVLVSVKHHGCSCTAPCTWTREAMCARTCKHRLQAMRLPRHMQTQAAGGEAAQAHLVRADRGQEVSVVDPVVNALRLVLHVFQLRLQASLWQVPACCAAPDGCIDRGGSSYLGLRLTGMEGAGRGEKSDSVGTLCSQCIRE
jgi:hypothetical protein